MRDTKACRACLNTKYRLVKIPDTWYRMFETLTGLQASKNDGYPNYFCFECKSHIHKAITFRKKSRRAFYVLKEIMTVRKEVNLPDILTVDRSRVSLESSLGIFSPQRSAVYSLCTANEGVSELAKEDLKMVGTCSVIDIKEYLWENSLGEVPEEIPEAPQALDDDTAADYFRDYIPEDNIGDDAQNIDTEEKEQEPEIDMNDIFKGLKEPESDNSDGEEKKKPVEEKKKIRKKKGEPKKEKIEKEVNDYTLSVKSRALLNYDIKELTEEEQKEVFKKKISNPIFAKALYTCGICIKVMPSVTALMSHFDIHMKKTEGKHLCQICKDKFMTAEDYELHTKESHMYQYTCKICQEVVYSIRDVVKHKREKHVSKYIPKEPIPDTASRINMINYEAELNDKFLLIPLSEEDKVTQFKKSNGVGKFVCDVCGLGLPTATQRNCHWVMHGRKPKRPGFRQQCSICGVWCLGEAALVKHMEAFHNYNYHCKLCSFEASNRYLAVDHLTRTHSEINACHICGVTSSTPVGLEAHIKARHDPLLRRHHCVVCGVSFQAHFSLYAHQFREHTFFKLPQPPTEGAANACTACDVQFLSTKAYHNHLVKVEHPEAKDLPWKCLPCRKVFDSEAEQRTHEAESCKHKTPVTMPGPCQECGEMISTYVKYYYHCKKFHPNFIPFNPLRKLCDICGNTYKSNKWPRHACLSRSSAKYKCSVCDIVFHRPTSVVFHVLKKHMKKPFSCSICNESFRRRYDCKDHILKVHAPVRPYQCPICNRDFSHIDFLKKHAEDLHDVKLQLDLKVPKRKDLFYLYPNMKVDLSLIDKTIVDDMKLKVCDYTDQILEPLHDYTDYVITSEDIRKKVEEQGGSKDFVIKNDDLKREEQEKSTPRKKAVKQSKKTKKQQYIDFITGNDDEDQGSARTHHNFKEIIIEDVDDIQEEISGNFNREYVITEDLFSRRPDEQTRKKHKQDHRGFIIRGVNVRPDQSVAPPSKKSKYERFDQEF